LPLPRNPPWKACPGSPATSSKRTKAVNCGIIEILMTLFYIIVFDNVDTSDVLVCAVNTFIKAVRVDDLKLVISFGNARYNRHSRSVVSLVCARYRRRRGKRGCSST
jgi:hypothetical protein